MNKKRFLHILIVSVISTVIAFGNCMPQSMSFDTGEKLRYEIDYTLFFFSTTVGIATFEVKESKQYPDSVYFIDSRGFTQGIWDKKFRVRDTYQSWISKETLRPIKFNRDVDEGGYTIKAQYDFDRGDSIAYSTYENNKKEITVDTLPISDCTLDVLSSIYYSRSVDFKNLNEGDKVPIQMILDNEIENVYFRFQGKENVKLDRNNKYRCLKFTAYVVKGSVFEGGEVLNVWVTDDDNRIPVVIETPLKVGSIKVGLVEMSGLKYPLKAKL